MSSSDRRSAVVLLAAALLLASCGGRDFAYQSGREIPPGPGLLTGPEGAIVIGGRPAAAPRERTEDGDGTLPADRPPTGTYAPAP